MFIYYSFETSILVWLLWNTNTIGKLHGPSELEIYMLSFLCLKENLFCFKSWDAFKSWGRSFFFLPLCVLVCSSFLASQGLRSEFQSTGANHYLMTLMQSKTVHFSFFSESFWKIDGCKWVFLKIDGCNCTRCTRPNGAL